MSNFIQQNLALFLFLFTLAVFSGGYFCGNYYGEQSGFVRGRIAGRKYSSNRDVS